MAGFAAMGATSPLDWCGPDQLRRSRSSNLILVFGAAVLLAVLVGSPRSVGAPVRTFSGLPTAAVASADGRELTLRFIGAAPYDADNPCSASYRAVLNETDDEVRLRILERSSHWHGLLVCTLEGYPRTVVAALDDPIGARDLVVGPDGRTTPVTTLR